jgi:pimeloyl-ACP methyl ester carboxylesterase
VLQLRTRHVDGEQVSLAFTDEGFGGVPILLVHGMRCDHRHMEPLAAHLRLRNRVVSIDLRGHGMSDKPMSAYSNEELTDDLLWLCAELKLERPIIVGHSFGGSLALSLAVRQPKSVRAIVLLDSGIRTTAEKQAEMGAVIAGGSTAGESSGQFFADRLFGRDDDAALKADVLAVMTMPTPLYISEALGRTVLGFDSGAAALACTVPALFVLADRPFTTPEMLAQLPDNWRVGQVVGAGHFVQVFAADQVSAMVDQFLRLL